MSYVLVVIKIINKPLTISVTKEYFPSIYSNRFCDFFVTITFDFQSYFCVKMTTEILKNK